MAAWLAKLLGTDSAIKAVGNLADDAFNTSQERMETDQVDTASARAMQTEGHMGKLLQIFVATDALILRFVVLVLMAVDLLVDAVARLIRPWITVHLTGGLFGYWGLPAVDSVDEFYQTAFWTVLTFWFGGRAVMKDIPAMIGAIAKIRRKLR